MAKGIYKRIKKIIRKPHTEETKERMRLAALKNRIPLKIRFWERVKTTMRFLIQYQYGPYSGTREVSAANEKEAIEKLWESLQYVIPKMPGIIRAEEILEIFYE